MSTITSAEIEAVELKTRGQSDNPAWKTARLCRLTVSSHFHAIKHRNSSRLICLYSLDKKEWV